MIRRFHLLLLLATVLLGTLGITRLSYNVEILDLLPKDMRGVEGTKLLRDVFERGDQMIITLEVDRPDDAQAAVESLEKRLLERKDVARRVMVRPTWESEPEQIAELAAYAWLNAKPEMLKAFEESLAPEKLKTLLEEKLAAMATAVDGATLALGGYDPVGVMDAVQTGLDPRMAQGGASSSEFSSRDGRFRLVLVDPPGSSMSYRDADVWVRAIREVVEGWQKEHPEWSGLRSGFTGAPVFRAEIATGMEADMRQSVGGITIIVAFLFWLLHRTIKPLFLLVASMFCSMLLTLGIAGVLYGSLNVMSMGFAAILMGMIEDFGVVGLHEWLDNPTATFRQIHRRVFPGIFWSAITSAMVFGSLSFSVLPGVAQLGTLTAVGILVGAVVMLYGFLPLAMRWSSKSHDRPRPERRDVRWSSAPGIIAGALLALCAGTLLLKGFPTLYRGTDLLYPKNCQSLDAILRLQKRMQPAEGEGELLPVFVTGNNEAAVEGTLLQAQAVLEEAKKTGEVTEYYLPDALLPHPQRQRENAAAIFRIAKERNRVLAAVDAAGFTEDAARIASGVFGVWQKWTEQAATEMRWPSQELLDGSLGRLVNLKPGRLTGSGYARLAAGKQLAQSNAALALEKIPGSHPGGWRYLNANVNPLLNKEFVRVVIPAAVVLFVLLIVVFRNVKEILLVLGSLLFSGLILITVMSALGIPWNFVNIGAVPLSLGLGLDFNIHMIFSLRRLHSEAEAEAHGIGRALAYCGLSTALGFGSLALAGNQGLISFGQCAMIGVGATLFSAAFVLPWVYTRVMGWSRSGNQAGEVAIS